MMGTGAVRRRGPVATAAGAARGGDRPGAPGVTGGRPPRRPGRRPPGGRGRRPGPGIYRSTALVGDLTLGGHMEKDTDGADGRPVDRGPAPGLQPGAARDRRAAQARLRHGQEALRRPGGQGPLAGPPRPRRRDRGPRPGRVLRPGRRPAAAPDRPADAVAAQRDAGWRVRAAPGQAGRDRRRPRVRRGAAGLLGRRAELDRAAGGRVEPTLPTTRPAAPGPESTTQPAADESLPHHHHHHGE